MTGAVFRRQSKDPLEFYETPPSAVHTIRPHLPRFSSVLDPCCGKGSLLRATGLPPAMCFGIEINKNHHEANARGRIYFRDALDSVSWPDADAILVNPPYSHAATFVQRALYEARSGVTVAFLLRLAFLESFTRFQLHAKHPSDVFVFSERPSFSGNGKTDSAAYAWFVWGPGRGGRWQVLPPASRGK